jgi:hypothetical protein
MVFESANIIFNLFVFGVLLVIFDPQYYEGEGFANMLAVGLMFCITAIPRYYCLSLFVDDVKMAQNIFFYGTLYFMFGLLYIYFSILSTSGMGHCI